MDRCTKEEKRKNVYDQQLREEEMQWQAVVGLKGIQEEQRDKYEVLLVRNTEWVAANEAKDQIHGIHSTQRRENFPTRQKDPQCGSFTQQ